MKGRLRSLLYFDTGHAQSTVDAVALQTEKDSHSLITEDNSVLRKRKHTHPVFEPSEFVYDESEEPSLDFGYNKKLKATIDEIHRNKSMNSEEVPASTNIKQTKNGFKTTRIKDNNYMFIAPTVKTTTIASSRNQSQVNLNQIAGIVPWLKEKHLEKPINPVLCLHNELYLFYQFIASTDEEKTSRQQTYDILEKLILEALPESKVSLYGSTRHETCIPTSDVDICVTNCPKDAIYTISNKLDYKNLVSYNEVITGAKIPIVKGILKSTGISFDICFGINQEAGYHLIQNFLEISKEAQILIVILKYFFFQRNKNEAFFGYFSSHFVTLSVIAVIQMSRKKLFSKLKKNNVHESHIGNNCVANQLNLGSLFLEYFRYYGHHLNTEKLSISLLNGGHLHNKFDTTTKRKFPGWLSIKNPVDESLDVGSAAFHFPRLRTALFQEPYVQLLHSLNSYYLNMTRERQEKPISLLRHVIINDESLSNRVPPSTLKN